jgi:hypothetical protein
MLNKTSYRKGYLTADFLSQTYRISGDASLRQGPIVDVLNDVTTIYVRLENVYVSPITDPAIIKGNYPFGQVRKDNLTMVVLATPEEAQSRRPGASTKQLPVVYNMFITVPGFEVQGGVRIESAVDVDRLFVSSTERFIPVYNATATVTTNPRVQFTGGAILINRDQIGLFCIEKSTT